MTSKDLRALVEETGFNANNNMSGTLIFHLIKGKEELIMMTLMFLESNSISSTYKLCDRAELLLAASPFLCLLSFPSVIADAFSVAIDSDPNILYF